MLQSTSADKPKTRDSKQKLRGEIGACLKKRHFGKARTAEPSLRDSLKRIEELDRYFTAVPPIPTETAKIPLPRYFSELENAPRIRLADENEEASLHSLRAAAAALRQDGVALTNRSSVRLAGQRLVAREKMTQEVFEALCEFCDSCYNSMLHDSSRATRAVYTTPPYPQSGETLEFAQSLSTEIASRLRVGGRAPRTKRGRLSFTVMEEAAALDSPLFRPKALWALLNDGDWRRSVDSLQSALAKGNRLRAEKALDKHIEFLTAAWMGDALKIDLDDKPESAFRTEMTSPASVSQTVFALLAEWFTKAPVHSALNIALAAHVVGAAAGAAARKAKAAHAANVLHRSVGLIE